MHVDINDIELAMEFVSGGLLDNDAYINSATGEIYYSGDAVDEELPEDIDQNETNLLIPSKQDLGLAKQLALDFTAETMPDEFNNVYAMFSSRGAYDRFKSLLHSLAATEKWYAYEQKAIEKAIIAWCKEHEIQYKS